MLMKLFTGVTWAASVCVKGSSGWFCVCIFVNVHGCVFREVVIVAAGQLLQGGLLVRYNKLHLLCYSTFFFVSVLYLSIFENFNAKSGTFYSALQHMFTLLPLPRRLFSFCLSVCDLAGLCINYSEDYHETRWMCLLRVRKEPITFLSGFE